MWGNKKKSGQEDKGNEETRKSVFSVYHGDLIVCYLPEYTETTCLFPRFLCSPSTCWTIGVLKIPNQELRFQFWILYSGVVHSLQAFDEHHLCHADVAEVDRTVAEETFLHLTVDQPVHEIADALFRIFFQRT